MYALVQWEGCPEMCHLQGGCPFLRGSFIGGLLYHLSPHLLWIIGIGSLDVT